MAANAININNFEINNVVENQIQELLNEASTSKEKKAVHELKAMIADVMESLSSKGSAKADTAAVSKAPSSGSSYEEAVVLLAGVLAEMQILLTQVVKDKGQADAKLAQAQVDAMEANIKVVADLIQKQIDAQNNASIWQKVAAAFAIIVGAILCAVGLPEIGAVMIVLGVLQITGALGAITDGLVNFLVQDCGMSKEAATILADAVIVAIATVASMGIGGVAAGIDSAASEAVDGIEMSVLNEAGEVAESGAADTVNAVKQGATQATRMTRGAIAGFFQSALATNLASNIVAAIPFPDTSDGRTAKKWIEGIATLIMVIASIVASFGTGAVDAISKAGGLMTNVGRASAFFEGVGAVASGTAAGYGIDAGVIQWDLAAPESIEELQETTLSMMNGDEKATAKFMASIQQTLKAELSLMNRMFVGQKAMADVMARA